MVLIWNTLLLICINSNFTIFWLKSTKTILPLFLSYRILFNSAFEMCDEMPLALLELSEFTCWKILVNTVLIFCNAGHFTDFTGYQYSYKINLFFVILVILNNSILMEQNSIYFWHRNWFSWFCYIKTEKSCLCPGKIYDPVVISKEIEITISWLLKEKHPKFWWVI